MRRNQYNSKPEQSCMVIMIGMIIAYFVFKLEAFLWISIAIGMLASVSNLVAKKIEWFWMQISWILSLIVPNILLSLIYYLILTPTAYLSKVFSKKTPLILKNNRNSLFVTTNKTFRPQDFEKLW